jgi:hypothetical protein
MEALGHDAVDSSRNPIQGPPARVPLGELGLLQDPDDFLQLALVRLELLFEWDPLIKQHLEGLEEILEDLEGLGWPTVPARLRGLSDRVDYGRVFGNSEELASGDLPVGDRPRSGRAGRQGLLPGCLQSGAPVPGSGIPGRGRK